MRILRWLAVTTLALSSMSIAAQKTKAPRSYRSSGDKPVSVRLGLATGLSQQLAKWRAVKMRFRAAGLTPRQRQMIEKLVDASRYLDDIYWRQSDPEGLTLFHELEGNNNRIDAEVRRMLMINGSRFDLLRNNEPFVGSQAVPPGRGFYPPGLTREQIEQYVQQHPESKAEIYSPYTVVRWQGKELVGVPYHVAYRSLLGPAARDLRAAATLSDDPAFAKFLRLRADALFTDDYYPSDLAWLDLKDPKFDVIFAPYETYLDSLLGVKTSYGAAVLIRNQAESRKLALYEKYVPEIQDALPLAADDRPSKRGLATPMEVMDAPFRGGDLRHGYQAVADNLPNDARIHEAKGTKKIFFKNFMDARVNYVILPVAKRVMRPDQAAKVTGEGYLAGTLLHEMSHGLGPAFARTTTGKADIREAIGPTYSELEEAKADAVGMFGLKWLVDHGALPKSRMQEYYASYVGGLFRTVRFGTGEAHGRAEMMEFNYLTEQKAVTRDSATGRYSLDYAKMPAAVEALAKELLEQEATGDRARAEAWFKKYDTMPEDLKASLQKAADVPVDIDPVFSFPERVK